MKLKKLKQKDNVCDDKHTVPCPESTKSALKRIKNEYQIDVNAMTRDFWNHLIDQTLKSSEEQAAS